MSKTFEKFVAEWLATYVAEKMDTKQFGGKKGASIEHYLIEFVTFILYNQDLKEARAVLAAMVDFQKAFNRQDHTTLITILADMGVPGWLLFIIMGFLTDRVLVVAYMGEDSQPKAMPGGGPQGTVLGMLLFLVLINQAGFQESEPTLGAQLTMATNARKAINTMHAKFVDDLTIAESIDLRKALTVETDKTWNQPLNYHERTKQVLKHESEVQKQLTSISEYAVLNKMKINQNKTKIMLFNNSKQNDFLPELKLNGKNLEVVEQMKLLGVIITSDLKWHENTNNIVKKASKKMWILRRLRNLGASRSTLLDIYMKYVRSVVEFSTVVWHAGLTKENTEQIERVQKAAFAIILGGNYKSYENACTVLSMMKLAERREKLSLNFANKAVWHPEHKEWFAPQVQTYNTRTPIKPFKPAQAKTQRLLNSAIPHMTHLLNTC